MAKKELRLQFSGFAVFAAKLISVATGFAFQFLLARSIGGSAQYNIWFNITDIITYFTLLGGVVPFWVMRYIARGKKGAAKTGLVTNLIISGIFAAGYLAAAPLILAALHITSNYLPLYLIASLQIVELCSLNVLESCLQPTHPQAVGYGLILQQIAKLSIGYVLIVFLGLPLLGAVLAILASFALQVVYYYRLIWEETKEKIEWGYVKEWLKSSTATIYNVIGSQLVAFVLILLYDLGSNSNPDLTGARGFYGAAVQIAQIVAYSSFLSFALYPKLLAEQKREDIATSFKLVLMFAIPMTVGAIALADSYMGLLRPEFRSAANVLVVLAADAFITVISGFYSQVLFGLENVDETGVSFRKLIRSRIFLAFSLPYVQAAIAIPVSYYVLTTYAFHLPVEAAFYVSLINIVAHAVSFVVLFVVIRNVVKVEIPWFVVSKYVFASAVMGAVMYFVPHPNRIFTTLLMTAVGGAIYLGLLIAIDKEARELPKSVFHEIKTRTFG